METTTAITRQEFIDSFIKDVKIIISNRDECYQFQKIAFEFGVKCHSCMDDELQTPIAYNIADLYPEYAGRSFATDMHNLCIYDNGTRLQQSSFYYLENNLKEIKFTEFIEAYNSIF